MYLSLVEEFEVVDRASGEVGREIGSQLDGDILVQSLDKTEAQSGTLGVEASLDEGIIIDLVRGGEDNADTSEEGSTRSTSECDVGGKRPGLGELLEVVDTEGRTILVLLSGEDNTALLAAGKSNLTLKNGSVLERVLELGSERVDTVRVVGSSLNRGSLGGTEGVGVLQAGGQVASDVVDTSVEGCVVGSGLELESSEGSEGEGGINLGGVVGSELTLVFSLDITNGKGLRRLEGTSDGAISVPLGNEHNLGSARGLGGDLSLNIVLSRGENVLHVVISRLSNIIKVGGHFYKRESEVRLQEQIKGEVDG